MHQEQIFAVSIEDQNLMSCNIQIYYTSFYNIFHFIGIYETDFYFYLPLSGVIFVIKIYAYSGLSLWECKIFSLVV